MRNALIKNEKDFILEALDRQVKKSLDVDDDCRRINAEDKVIDMENIDIFGLIDGIPSKEMDETITQEYYEKIRRELKKISKEDILGYNLKAVDLVRIIIDKECDYDKQIPPSYRLYVNGTSDTDLQDILDKAICDFIEKGNYFFHYYCKQLQRELPNIIADSLNKNNEKDEYWCKLLYNNSRTVSGKRAYIFVVLCFNKIELEKNVTYNGKRHPYLDALKTEWSFGKVNDIDDRKINYNELFRRASYSNKDRFVYLYADIFDALSELKYESEENYGSMIALCVTDDKDFDEVKSNYDISIKFKETIKIEDNSYRKIRKLMEIAKNELSLLMNGSREIYAIGKMIDNPSCEFYKICFEGFLKWTLYKNNEKFLCFENKIPKIPSKERGIGNKEIKLLRRTFGITDTLKIEKIIQAAAAQKHGTMVAFAENANDEANRLKESGIGIDPMDISTGMLVEEITSIDGAIICDIDGICYSIGTILDGIKSEKVDLSRGSRYNSAIRYIEKQKSKQKKTFIVVISEDGYINCFSSEE